MSRTLPFAPVNPEIPPASKTDFPKFQASESGLKNWAVYNGYREQRGEAAHGRPMTMKTNIAILHIAPDSTDSADSARKSRIAMTTRPFAPSTVPPGSQSRGWAVCWTICLLLTGWSGVAAGSHSAAQVAQSHKLVLFGPVKPTPWLVTEDCPAELLDNAWIHAPTPVPTVVTRSASTVVPASGTDGPSVVAHAQHVAPAIAEVSAPTPVNAKKPEETPAGVQKLPILFASQPNNWLDVSPFATDIAETSGHAWLALSPAAAPEKQADTWADSVVYAGHEIATADAATQTTGPAAPGLIQPAGLSKPGPLTFDCEAPGCLSNGPAVRRQVTKPDCFAMRFLLSEPELAPLEALSPRLRRRAHRKNPYAHVVEYEAMPNVSPHVGPRCDVNVEHRATVPELSRVRLKDDTPVADMRLSTAPEAGRMPEDRSSIEEAAPVLVHVPGTTRGWCPQQMHWNASEATHAPLYFEDIALERSGYSRGYLQPAVSGIKFFATVPLLPGLMTIDPPLSTEYALGEVEPGSIVPYTAREPEWTYKAIAVEAGAVLGLAFLIP